MNFPQEYIDFLVHFHGDRDYFECHEILEDYWKKVDERNKDSIWVGLIQIAVSNYHHRRGNLHGAKRMLEKSLTILSMHKQPLEKLGLDATALFQQMEQHLLHIKNSVSYSSQQLPITPELLALCKKRSQELELDWGSESNMEDSELIHRHKRRDRSSVINERQQALQKKMNRRQ
ncbi:DUF309 domain-containing protein [Niallia sp. XMNu-256]|uniref:DUF309 domain-containing protein n=1 Tax=Niallia sp. XMNu-256 TaxID=3082444 RepID=UPI0030D4B0D4